MVGTKHCCLGECKRDSRYADKWPKLLRVRGIGENPSGKLFLIKALRFVLSSHIISRTEK